MRVALWSNQRDAVGYLPAHHTISLYLQGGRGTFRTDAPQVHGAPGKLCLMPAGHQVDWVVGEGQVFLHLYFEPQLLGPLVLRLLDREPREMQLPELNFAEQPQLAAIVSRLHLLDWSDDCQRLAANQLGHAAMACLVQSHMLRRPAAALRGGLSPAMRKRLIEWLQAHIASPLTVGQMAAQVALSEHHFAHAFATSFGCAPHAWLAARRVEHAAALLRQKVSPCLDAIAAATGHANPSHLVRRFRQAYGVTPGQYRAAMALQAGDL
nr:helix-turn-helix domain-containing protein [Corticibacter populi]